MADHFWRDVDWRVALAVVHEHPQAESEMQGRQNPRLKDERTKGALCAEKRANPPDKVRENRCCSACRRDWRCAACSWPGAARLLRLCELRERREEGTCTQMGVSLASLGRGEMLFAHPHLSRLSACISMLLPAYLRIAMMIQGS